MELFRRKTKKADDAAPEAKVEKTTKKAPAKTTKAKAEPKAAKAPKAKKVETTETKEVAVASEVSASGKDLAHIIRSPRITEKASMMAEANVYAFEVATTANKKTVAAAVKEMFNVTPVKIAIVNIPTKTKFIRNKMGTTGGGKKAYVYLKKGETIEFA